MHTRGRWKPVNHLIDRLITYSSRDDIGPRHWDGIMCLHNMYLVEERKTNKNQGNVIYNRLLPELSEYT